MRLTKNFHLKEFTKSGTASRMGLSEQFDPSEIVVGNLTALCENVLQPLRDSLKASIRIGSGYRCEALNKAIGGAKNSQHVKGQAADIDLIIGGKEDNGKLLNKIVSLYKKGIITFDQCISEFGSEDNPSWIHISYSKVSNRGQVLRAEKINGKTVYTDITKKIGL